MLALAPYALPLKPTDGELKRWLADGAIALGLRSFGRLVGWAVVRPERANTWTIVCTATSPGFRMAATARRVLRYTIATIKAHEGRSLTIELGLDNSADGPRIADIAALCARATGNVPEAVTIPGGTRLRIPLRNAADSVMPRPTFRAEALEQRILMSATWIDADGDALVGATEGDDIAIGDDSADYIEGLGGNDQLFGGGGHDQLFGGDGDDLLRGGAGADLLDGGAGQDQADYSGAAGPVTVDLTTACRRDRQRRRRPARPRHRSPARPRLRPNSLPAIPRPSVVRHRSPHRSSTNSRSLSRSPSVRTDLSREPWRARRLRSTSPSGMSVTWRLRSVILS